MITDCQKRMLVQSTVEDLWKWLDTEFGTQTPLRCFLDLFSKRGQECSGGAAFPDRPKVEAMLWEKYRLQTSLFEMPIYRSLADQPTRKCPEDALMHDAEDTGMEEASVGTSNVLARQEYRADLASENMLRNMEDALNYRLVGGKVVRNEGPERFSLVSWMEEGRRRILAKRARENQARKDNIL